MDAACVWLLTGPRPGEVGQQRALAAALNLRVEEKPVYAAQAGRNFGWCGQHAAPDGLAPPWPAATISFGKTLAAARWVQRASGGGTRLIHLGRPRGVAFDRLDLIVAMPQDRVPEAANVVHLRMPLNQPEPSQTRFNAPLFEQLTRLPRPRHALFIGGSSRRFGLDLMDTLSLLRAAAMRVAERGGSLLVSTSPRTPQRWLLALRQMAPVGGHFYRFRPDDPLNPRRAYLEIADEFIVTGDSASMLAECWRTGKPVYAGPPPRPLRMRESLRSVLLPRRLDDGLVRAGLLSATVDVAAWLRALAAEQRIGLFGQSSPRRLYRAEIDDELPRLAQRVRALLETSSNEGANEVLPLTPDRCAPS